MIGATMIPSPNVPANHITAARLASAVQDVLAYVTIVAANKGTPDGTASVTIQAKDAAGNDLAARCLVRTWTSGRAGADMGAPAAIDTDYSVTTGTEIEEVTADGDYIVLTDASGTIVMDADDTQDGTLYFMADIGGLVYSDSVAITGT